MGIFWKCARIGERLSPYVSIFCVVMAVRFPLSPPAPRPFGAPSAPQLPCCYYLLGTTLLTHLAVLSIDGLLNAACLSHGRIHFCMVLVAFSYPVDLL
jgi:hypothetical protein